MFSVTVHTKDVTHNNMEEEELVKIGKLNLVSDKLIYWDICRTSKMINNPTVLH